MIYGVGPAIKFRVVPYLCNLPLTPSPFFRRAFLLMRTLFLRYAWSLSAFVAALRAVMLHAALADKFIQDNVTLPTSVRPGLKRNILTSALAVLSAMAQYLCDNPE